MLQCCLAGHIAEQHFLKSFKNKNYNPPKP
jgi:hypothetical protein